MPICASCGQENPEQARFCLACGLPLASADAAEERRVVTVLFVDLVGFTSRAEQLDPEDVRAVLTPYYARVRTELERFGGTVEKYVGDAVMAVFGAPVGHGDDPERGVRAALAVLGALRELNDAMPGLDLRARIAVNTGEAIVALGARPGHGEAMVAGDVVNTAARLQSAAPVGGVLVGRETYMATRTAIEYREADPVEARGKAAPVPVWVAVGERSSAGERAQSRVPLVGRNRELQRLRGIWDDAASGRCPHLVTVLGPAGIGKSRLCVELAELVVAEGGRLIKGRCVPYGASTAYGAFAQQVKQVAGIFDSDDLEPARARLRAMLAELTGSDDVDEPAGYLGTLVGLQTETTVSDREALFFAARLFVEGLASKRPTLLAFEDLHWGDASLLDLVETLAARVRDVPLLLLASARPELLSERPSWGGGLPAYTALQLEPLAGEAGLELASLLLARHGARRAEQAAALAETAEGNPLFIEELTASLGERTAATAEALPTSIRGIISARLDALPADERDVVLDAAVVGRVFWRGSLERMAAREGLADTLGSLEQRDLVRRETVSRIQGDQQFTFKHALIRDVAYATLPRARRRERHGAVARYLEEATSSDFGAAAELAHHWSTAGEPERALGYLVMAAEEAGRGWAKARAVELYQQALALVPEGDEERRRDLLRRQALQFQALYHLADVERQRARGATNDT